MRLKHIISLALILALSLCMFGCADKVTRDEAKEQINFFLDAVEAGDYDRAKTYLHPERQFDVKAFVEREELDKNIDFQKGIEITGYTDFSSAVYESEVDGSEYELEFNVVIGGVPMEINAEVVRNDQGFGIYSIEIDD